MKLLKSKAGVTVLEGIIALGLLAVVTAGAFGVLLSAARKSTQPDMREEMVMAVEKAKDMLQMYVNPAGYSASPDSTVLYPTGLCGGDATPLRVGTHNIKCTLPPICDKATSSFSYTVAEKGMPFTVEGEGDNVKLLSISFSISCNGYEL